MVSLSATRVSPAKSLDLGEQLRVAEVDTLSGWAEEWDQLSNHALIASPFLRSWWLDGVNTGRACYVLVYSDRGLVGGVALERRRRMFGVERYVALGSGKLCPDHLDLVAAPERLEDVMGIIRSWFQAKGARTLRAEGLVENSHLGRAIPASRVQATDVAIYASLPSSYAEYLRTRSKSRRQHLRRAARRFEADGFTFRRVEGAMVEAVLPAFWTLHACRAERQELLAHRKRIDRAVSAGAARGEVVAYVAEYGDETVAVYLTFQAQSRTCSYQLARRLGRDYDGIGNRMRDFAIEDACDHGRSEMDFLRGAEFHKLAFASQRRTLCTLSAAHGLRGRLILTAADAAAAWRTRVASAYRVLRHVATRRARSSNRVTRQGTAAGTRTP